jgi:hypothetical protein
MATAADNRSLGELMAELSRETSALVRKEFELAAVEVNASVREASTQVGFVGAGGALLHAGLLVLLATFVIALAQLGLEPWLAGAIVAIVTMIVGYVLMNKGRAGLRRTQLLPRQTIETLKENAKWTTGQQGT